MPLAASTARSRRRAGGSCGGMTTTKLPLPCEFRLSKLIHVLVRREAGGETHVCHGQLYHEVKNDSPYWNA
jgi:hypothetical protein